MPAVFPELGLRSHVAGCWLCGFRMGPGLLALHAQSCEKPPLVAGLLGQLPGRPITERVRGTPDRWPWLAMPPGRQLPPG